MNIKKRIHINVNKFMLDTSASMVIMFGAAMPVVLTVGGVGIDMLSVQNQENSANSRLNSVGSFASANNSCTGQSGSALNACASSLQSLVNDYANKTGGNISVTVTPGLWCTTSSGASSYVANGLCSSGSSIGAVKVVGTTSFDTRFLKLFGKSNISKTIEMILVDSRITSLNTAGICPGIILNAAILSNSQSGEVDWSEKTQSPRKLSVRELRVGDDSENDFQGETGSYSTKKPFWLYDVTGERTSFPTRETVSSNSKTPIDGLTRPSGNSIDVTAGTIVNVWSNSFGASSSSFGKKVTDRDYGEVDTSDNGGPQILRPLKKLEGQTCMALVGEEVSSNRVKLTGIIPMSLDIVCDGKRKRQGNKWTALKGDGKTTESKCKYESDTDRVDISLKFWYGEGRNSDNAAFTFSDKTKWGGSNKGDYSKGNVKAMRSPPNKVDYKSSFN